MKKYIFTLLAIISMLLLTSCNSGVSAEDYASVVAENTALKAEIESLSESNKTLSEQNEELLNQRTDTVLDNFSDEVAVAWAHTSFGDNSLCFSDDNNQYLQCIAGKTYTISDEGISDLWTDLSTSIKTLAFLKDSLPYESISIKFSDPSGIHILDIILNTDNDTNVTSDVLCNIHYADQIIPAMQNVPR